MRSLTLDQQLSLSDVEKIYGVTSAGHSDWYKLLTDEAFQQGAKESNQISYILATAKRETWNFTTLNEKWDSDYDGQHFDNAHDYFVYRYGGRLGNDTVDDGYTYRGRGFVQLTGETNYQTLGSQVSLDLVGDPDLAADPTNAAHIAVYGMLNGSFTSHKLDDYINSTGTNYIGARAIVNGSDQAALIAGYAEAYDKKLEIQLSKTSVAYTIDASSETTIQILLGSQGANHLHGGSGNDIFEANGAPGGAGGV